MKRRYALSAMWLCAAVSSQPLGAECVAEPKPPMTIGALIAIDDERSFRIAFDPPEDFLLDEGIHHLAIDAEGYRPLQFDVTIRANRTTTRRATLVRERRAH